MLPIETLLAVLLVIAGSALLLRSARRRRVARDRVSARKRAATMRSADLALFREEYIARSEADKWQFGNREVPAIAARPGFVEHLPLEERHEVFAICARFKNLSRSVQYHNIAFKERRIREDTEEFDRVERHPLTERQRLAIVTDEDTTLVVAGAGTGKTSTIVGKVDYLIRRKLAQPSEILVLAYTRKAREELSDRFNILNAAEGVKASTFHRLGLEIIGAVEGGRPTVSRLAGDDDALAAFIREQVAAMLADEQQRFALTRFFSELLDEDASEADVRTGDDYIRAERQSGLRTLDGIEAKSRQEVRIANWLVLNGIAYNYERPYPFVTKSHMHRQYAPDFYLPEYDLFIEHFGIDRNGNTRPGIDREEYLASMQWKRELHAIHGTTLVETFSYFDQEGGLPQHLAELLARHGVTPRPLTEPEIDLIVSEGNQPVSDFVSLLKQFLAVFKGNARSIESVTQRARNQRDLVFVEIFERVRAAYEHELTETECVDFNDMINRARSHVSDRRYTSRFRYIIVDEFQDISENRLGLLRELRAHMPHCRLFVVGDDWQGIFRFAGADVGLVANLEHHVGPTERVALDTTFRYSQELLDFSAAFIQRNPAQLRKDLRAYDGAQGGNPIQLIYSARNTEASERYQEERRVLRNALDAIRADATSRSRNNDARTSVLILGRYNRSQPYHLRELQNLYRGHGMDIEFLTVHRAKGKEADYVVVVGLSDGAHGFPANISDDPVMRMVLSDAESYPYAEERRLFYVAVTRARRRVYLIAPKDRASTFIRDDVLGTDLRGYVDGVDAVEERYDCPACEGRTIRRKTGKYGDFWGCTNFPLCGGKLDNCPECHSGGMVLHDAECEHRAFRCNGCGYEAEACPDCGRGYLQRKTSVHGVFLGCSRWHGGQGCRYRRNAIMYRAGW